MASSTPSSVRSEPIIPFFSGQEPSISHTSLLETSVDDNLSTDIRSVPPASSSIFINTPVVPKNDVPFDHLQRFSAPTSPVRINLGSNEAIGDVTFAGPIATTIDAPISRSFTSGDVDQPRAISTQRRRYHHYPHHAQNRNRYPYLQRPVSTKVLNGTQVPRSNLEGVTLYEHRPAFRRSYFALRKTKIPNAPPLPRQLYPGYRPSKPVVPAAESSQDAGQIEEEEEEGPPRKSFWVILRLVFFFFAIEYMYAVETALTIPIFSLLRVDESFFSLAWLISPILGFFLQPIIGMWSDTCKCRWGRRRPFILAFAIGAFIGVTLLLNGSDLGVLLGDSTEHDKVPTIAIILTAIGVTLLDFCADSADAPIRAYLIDTTNPSDQERGFNIHAILGFGGGLGFTVGAIRWPNIAMFRPNGGEFSVVFYIATFLFFACTFATLTSVREEPLISSSSSSSRDNNDDGDDNNDRYDDDDDNPEIAIDEGRPLLPLRRNSYKSYNTSTKTRVSSTADIYMNGLNKREGFVEIDPGTGKRIPHDHVERTNGDVLLKTLEQSHQIAAASMANSDPSNHTPVPTQAFDAELIQKAKLIKMGLMRRPVSEDSDDYDQDNVTIKSMLISMVRMPSRLWKLMICQVIGWIGYFATHLYFTEFVGTVVYGGSTANETTPAYEVYRHGVSMGCWGMFLYSASSAVYAFCLEKWLADRFSLKTLYFAGYFIYAIGCMVNFYVQQIVVNIIMCFTFGMMVVSLNTLPYHMLSQFHSDETYRNRDGTKRGIGVDCSLLNSCYFLGELIVAASLSPILESVGTKYCMVVGAVFSLIGNVIMFFLFFMKR